MNEKTTRIVSSETTNNGHSVDVQFQVNNKTYKIFFRTNGDTALSGNLESHLASVLLPCMKTGGGPLIANGEVSSKFITGLSTIQDIYCSWRNSLHRAQIRSATPAQKTSQSAKRVGAFFSGGVDSFYTLIKRKEEITDLIFVHGFDIELDNTRLREKVSGKTREVASRFGKNLIEIETNIHELLDPYVPWGILGHGAFLASIGHLLSPVFRRIFIPASVTYAYLFPYGTHPVLDHLWSSESLEFIHDGCEASRLTKVGLISKNDLALQSLRVCWKNSVSSYNCGQCEKCLRTMINLKVNNALDRCTTFDMDLDLKRVSKMILNNPATHALMLENLRMLEEQQTDSKLQKALRKALNRPEWKKKIDKRLRSIIKSIKKRWPK
jgi:hypothetical protein